MPDQNTRAMLIEAVVAGGLIAISFPTGQPLLALAAAATSVGCNWTHSLAERGFHHWRERWFTDDGALNHDISKALCHAFVDAVRQMEHDWKEYRYYQYLRHTSPEAAKLTLDALRLLREDGSALFQQPHQLAQVARQEPQERVLSLLNQDGSRASEYLKPALEAFLFGHDSQFVKFVTGQFGPHWVLRFVEILKDPGEEGTRAWRACQLLWQKSLLLSIDQIQQTATETAATVRWLREWAGQLTNLPPTQRDPLGQEALEEILHSVHAQLDEMQKTLDKTYATVLDIKAAVEQVYQKVAPAPSIPAPIWNVPFARNPFFTGRGQLLERLHEQLFQSRNAVLNQPASLSGLGGIGKTQTAIEYAYRYREAYSLVLWARADSRETLVADYLAIAHLLSLPGRDGPDQMQIVAMVKRWLEQQEGWLLILDNADDLSLVPDFLPRESKGHLLFTTRAQATGKIAKSLPVEKMELSEGMLLLLRRAKLLAEDESLDTVSIAVREVAQHLVEQLDGLPLALDQAGAYIEETACSLSEYLALYARHRLDLLKRQSSVSNDYPHTVASTWALSFSQIEQADPAAADLLRLCAFLHPDTIPETIMTEGVDQLGPHLQIAAADPLLFNDTIQLLRRYSLIKRDPEAKLLNLHRLVQVVLKESLDADTQRQWAERTVRAVSTAFLHEDSLPGERCEILLPHVQYCAELIAQYGFSFPEAARLLHMAGRYLKDRRQYAQAEPILEQALSLRQHILGAEHADTASTLNCLAELYSLFENYRRAELLLDSALPIYERTLGPEHPEVAYALNTLAAIYTQKGRYEQAELLLQRALAIREQVLEPTHPLVGDTLHALALLYYYQGKYAQAESLYRQTLVLLEKTVSSEHPDTLATLQNLALLYSRQGKYGQAEALFQQALAVAERVLGTENRQTLHILLFLGELHTRQGHYQQAEALLQRAYSLLERAWGNSSQLTFRALLCLADLSQAQNLDAQAATLYQQALVRFEQVLGPEHPYVAETLTCLAQLSLRQGNYGQAEALLERALMICEHALGSAHSKVATILNTQGHLALLQGREEQAEPLLQRALAIQEQALGNAHPDVADTLLHLAQLYEKQGKHEQACSLYQQALAIREQALGAEHPDTAETMHVLAQHWEVHGNNEEAKSLYTRALAIREQTLGAHYPKTVETRSHLIGLLHAMGHHEETAQFELTQFEQGTSEEERKILPEE